MRAGGVCSRQRQTVASRITLPHPAKLPSPQELEQAFSLFNEASAQLASAYQDLQDQVVRLTAELAVANGELRTQYEQKEALSRRLGLLLDALPEGEPMYPPDYVTDQPDRFFVSEIVREAVLQLTHDELPFSTAVMVDRFEEPVAGTIPTMYCTILVDRESQKPIVIGKGGAMIKQIGTAARLELERFFATRIHLDLHVKVKSEWRDDERVLNDMGMQGRDR